MFKKDACDLCGDCLVECQWMDVERDQAEEWMKQMINGDKTPVVDRCITCYACNEICPQDANPFDLIAELQEKYHLVPQDTINTSEQRYLFSGELKDVPKADRVMSICVFGKTDGHLIQGELYDLPRVGGKPYFCWILFTHMGAPSIQEKHAQEFVDRLAMTGAKEIVCFHDDCYAMLAKIAPEYGITVPFRPVHLSEYLVDYLKENKDRIKPLNIDVAYNRPCASRHTPEKEHFIDELFELAGVNRVERAYDREKALCCAGVKSMLGMGDAKADQEKNIRDAKDAGGKAIVCLCPMCMQSLSTVAEENKIPLIFLGDIARMALGEIDPPV
ncbi:MAG: (Fe-S)-binding protein [Deltaproteobacteria bacterium]|nr:(Fe-S)-binding protein [Deltaproteobacteria bacterium]MBW1984466.1 (Fe-S)-binding protein [Deltaproteobacteria bacterium]MBW2180836.1 (Fe-S)-binding protein [Deltaproteobacteria bacterium]